MCSRQFQALHASLSPAVTLQAAHILTQRLLSSCSSSSSMKLSLSCPAVCLWLAAFLQAILLQLQPQWHILLSTGKQPQEQSSCHQLCQKLLYGLSPQCSTHAARMQLCRQSFLLLRRQLWSSCSSPFRNHPCLKHQVWAVSHVSCLTSFGCFCLNVKKYLSGH